MAPVRILRAAIEATDDPEGRSNADGDCRRISDRQFAIQVLHIDERTLRSYLAREHRIPGPVLALCQRIIADNAPAAVSDD